MILPPPSSDPALYGQLVYCEGYEAKPYRDGGGNLTIGVGWNLSANGLPDWAIRGLCDQAVDDAVSELDGGYPWWRSLDAVRGRAMVNLVFNMGEGTFAKFSRFHAAMQSGQWATARDELESAAWYGQVGRRGPMILGMISSGLDPHLSE